MRPLVPSLMAFAVALTFPVPVRAKSFSVTSAADAGPGTLRDALTQAMDETTNPGLDTITFAIPASAVPTIFLESDLPQITSPVFIDGTTQTPQGQVRIDGGSTLDGALVVGGGGGSTVSGLVVTNFASFGIELVGNAPANSPNNTVVKCVVGPNVTNAPSTQTASRGIWVKNSNANVIGGSGRGNVVSGNGTGIAIEGEGATSNVVEGNVVGLAADGSTVLGNTSVGVRIDTGATANRVGASSSTGRNVISGNGVGVRLSDSTTQSNQIQGNYIGTDASGTLARPNGTGVLIDTANGNTIGGTSSGAGNVVSGNTGVGIDVRDVVAGGNTIFQNLVGTTAAGTAAVPNASGVRLIDCTALNQVGGAGGGNVISGNTGNGINITQSNGQLIQGNFIGVARDGSSPLGNGKNGVSVTAGSNNKIGVVPNRIAFNAQNGVVIVSKTGSPVPSGDTISANQIFGNAELGIDLGNNGITPNDPGDSDTGPNELQNFPDLTPLLPVASTVVTGSLDSTPSMGFRIEVFSNLNCPNGDGQGQTFLGSVPVTTDASGHAAFSLTVANPLQAGSFLTSTATASDGSTSEFSACTAAVGATVTTTTTTATSTTRPHRTTTTNVSLTTTTRPGPFTTTTVPPQGPFTTVPGGGSTSCVPEVSFASLECRLDALLSGVGAAGDLGRRQARVARLLGRTAKATRDADGFCAHGHLQRTRARLRRALRLVIVARRVLEPPSASQVSADAAALANGAGAIRSELRALRLQVHCS